MASLVTWIKDNGDEIKLNTHPANVAHAEKMGWKKKGARVKKDK